MDDNFLKELLDEVNSDWNGNQNVKIIMNNTHNEKIKLIKNIHELANKAAEFDFILASNMLNIIKFSLTTKNQKALEYLMRIFYKQKIHPILEKN